MNTLIIRNYLVTSKTSLGLFEARVNSLITQNKIYACTDRPTRPGLRAYVEESDASIALFTLFSSGISSIINRKIATSGEPFKQRVTQACVSVDAAEVGFGKVISKSLVRYMEKFHDLTNCMSLSRASKDNLYPTIIVTGQFNDDLLRSAKHLFQQTAYIFPPNICKENEALIHTLKRIEQVMTVIDRHRPLNRDKQFKPSPLVHL